MPYCLLSLTKIHSFVNRFLSLAVITGCSVSWASTNSNKTKTALFCSPFEFLHNLLTHQYAYSLYHSLYTSQGADKENLSINWKLFNLWSFPLFSGHQCLIQRWYCKEKLNASHSWWIKDNFLCRQLGQFWKSKFLVKYHNYPIINWNSKIL